MKSRAQNIQLQFNTQGLTNSSNNISQCKLGRIFGGGKNESRKRDSQIQNNYDNKISKLMTKSPYYAINIVKVNLIQSCQSKLDLSNILSPKKQVQKVKEIFHPIVDHLCTCLVPCPWGRKWTLWSKNKEDNTLYDDLKKTPVKQNMLRQIQKDIKRTQPTSKGFRSFTNRKLLQQVLQTYSKYDKQLQYIQGMNMIASVILYHVHKPDSTFWILVDVMERKQFRQIYVNNFQNLQNHTMAVNNLLTRCLPQLSLHFQKLQVLFHLVTRGWLLSLLCNVVPLEHAHLVLDRFIVDGWKALYQIIVSYLKYKEQQLLLKTDSSDILSHFSTSLRQQSTEWEQIINYSINFI